MSSTLQNAGPWRVRLVPLRRYQFERVDLSRRLVFLHIFNCRTRFDASACDFAICLYGKKWLFDVKRNCRPVVAISFAFGARIFADASRGYLVVNNVQKARRDSSVTSARPSTDIAAGVVIIVVTGLVLSSVGPQVPFSLRG